MGTIEKEENFAPLVSPSYLSKHSVLINSALQQGEPRLERRLRMIVKLGIWGEEIRIFMVFGNFA